MILCSAASSSVVVYRRSPLVRGTSCPLLVRSVVGWSFGVGQDPDDIIPLEEGLGERRRPRSGVRSNALATAVRASRRVNVDPSRVRGMARGLGLGCLEGQRRRSPSHRAPRPLAGQESENGSDLLGSWLDGRLRAGEPR